MAQIITIEWEFPGKIFFPANNRRANWFARSACFILSLALPQLDELREMLVSILRTGDDTAWSWRDSHKKPNHSAGNVMNDQHLHTKIASILLQENRRGGLRFVRLSSTEQCPSEVAAEVIPVRRVVEDMINIR